MAGRGRGQLTPSRWRRASARGRGPCARPTSCRAPRWDREKKGRTPREKGLCRSRRGPSFTHPEFAGLKPVPPCPPYGFPDPPVARRLICPNGFGIAPATRRPGRLPDTRGISSVYATDHDTRRFASTKSRGRLFFRWRFFVRAFSLRFWVGVVDVDFFIFALVVMIKSVVAKTASHLRRAGAFLFFEPGFGKLRRGNIQICAAADRAPHVGATTHGARDPGFGAAAGRTGGDPSLLGAETRLASGVTRRRVCVLRKCARIFVFYIGTRQTDRAFDRRRRLNANGFTESE